MNTFIAKPECVISIAGRGAWPIEESEIIYYNWWAVDEAGVEWAYNEYREYISKYAEIIDQGESFTFVNNNGDKVTVRFSSDSVLQVRAPR